MFKVTRQALTSNPPSAVCAGFFTKFGNYWTLLILDNATVNSRHQDPLLLGLNAIQFQIQFQVPDSAPDSVPDSIN